MRIVRVLLLVLLAFTLPVRGVMAAAMWCPPSAGAAGHAHASRAAASDDHVHANGAAHHHEAEAADEAADMASAHHDDAASGSHTCNLCAACCSVPPVPSAAPAVPVLRDPAAAVFPAYSVPAPSFLSDGQERPPRSI